MTGSNPYRIFFKVSTAGYENERIYSFQATSLIETTANANMFHSYPESNYKSFVNSDDVNLWDQSIPDTNNRIYNFFYNSIDPTDEKKSRL